MLPDSELRDLRNELENTLPDVCDIKSCTYSVDGGGNFTETWTAVKEDVRCRVDNVRGYETAKAEQVKAFQVLIMTMPHDTVIATSNRVTYAGNDYAVTAVTSGSWLGIKRVALEKL